MTDPTDYIVAEFKGTYRAPHPDGIRDANVTKNFHVKVKMKRECLDAPGLKGLFQTYYKEFLRRKYPDMIDTYEFDMLEATEVDGSVIDDPKALSYDGMLTYITKRRVPINASLYSPMELRNQLVLHQADPKGQQHLQKKLTDLKGNMLAVAKDLATLDDVMIVCEPEQPTHRKPAGKQPAGVSA